MNQEAPIDEQSRSATPSLREVAAVFLKIGLLGFGGPAAHVALMRREVVERRYWVDEKRFLRMFAACSLVPGPSSTELAIFLGYVRAGWPALVLAGVLFIVPAMLLMLLIAWAYVRYGATPAGQHILYGVRPVVVAIVTWALLDVGRRVLATRYLIPVAAAVFALSLVGLNPILLLFAAAALVALPRLERPWDRALVLSPLPAATAHAGRLLPLFLTFLKIGAVSYGSGYVLLSFLHADFVAGLHWLTPRQLVDAVAIGQATPGPVFTTATFLGYLFAGLPGALLATLGIFLPAFLLVPLLNRLVGFVDSRPWARAALDGANAATIGLIAAVTVTVGMAAIVDPITTAIAALSLLILLRYPFSSAGLVAAGGVVGLAVAALPPHVLHL